MDDSAMISINPEMMPLLHIGAAFGRSMPASPRRQDQFLGGAYQVIHATTKPMLERLMALHGIEGSPTSYTWYQERTLMLSYLEVCFAAGVEVRWGYLERKQSDRIVERATELYCKRLADMVDDLLQWEVMGETEAVAQAARTAEDLQEFGCQMRDRGHDQGLDQPRLNDELLQALLEFLDDGTAQEQ